MPSLTLILLQSVCAAAALLPRGATPKRPTTDGVTPQCTWWHDYDAVRPLTEILTENAITLVQFRQWNPSVSADGQDLTIGRSYCVEASFDTPQPSPQTPETPQPPQPPQTSSDTTPTRLVQPGIAPTCTAFYTVQPGDSCWNMATSFGTFSLPDFYAWNPAVRRDCSRLLAGFDVCVGVPGTPAPLPESKGPKPIQRGVHSACSRFHQARAGDNCWAISAVSGIELDDFIKWNPAVTRGCTKLVAGYHYCVGLST